MAQATMYSGINNSPQTVLSAGISATDTTIPVASVSVFPEAPNLATLGVEDDAEVIRYGGISGLTLINCERGFGGTTAKVWQQNELIYRGYTKYDHDTFKENIEDLDNVKLSKTGDAKDATVTASAAASRANLTTGDKLSVIVGKLMKWYADFKALAWKASVETSDIDANAVTNAKLSQMASKTMKGNNGNAAATPTDLTASQVRAIINVADGADVTKTTLEATSVMSAIADGDKIIVEDTSEAAGSQTKHILWSSVKSALQNLFAPLSHASRHATTGADAITPSSIGAAAASVEVSGTMAASAWAGSSITITGLTGVTSNTKGAIGLPDTATAEQRAAARAAQLTLTGKGSGSVTITADGAVPTINIPFVILIVG